MALGSIVHLDGQLSSDPEHQPLHYAWSIQSKPPGSAAALSASNIVNPTFVADKAGQYVVPLIVDDGALNSASVTVRVDTADSRPVANAGPAQSVNAGATVQLDGSASFDPDGPGVVLQYAGRSPHTRARRHRIVRAEFRNCQSDVPGESGGDVRRAVDRQRWTLSLDSIDGDGHSREIPRRLANNDTYTTVQDTPLVVGASGVLGNDSDAQSDPLTANLVIEVVARHADAQRERWIHLHAERRLQRTG